MNTKEIFKLGILSNISEGKEPKIEDYAGEDFTSDDFMNLVNEMQNEGLIKGVVFAKQGNKLLVPFLNTALTEYGKTYLLNKI